MYTKEQLIQKRGDLARQVQEAAVGVERAKAVFNQVQGAAIALDLLIAEYDKPVEEPKPAKKGKK